MKKLYLSTAIIISMMSAQSYAEPTGGKVVRGNADIVQSGKVTDINQHTHRVDINWKDFSSKADETINFNQPNTNAIAINRVIGGVPSSLAGALNANGRVVVINDSGITFQKGSKTNVGALVATTASIVNSFDNEDDVLSFGDTKGKIINDGDIKAADSGFVTIVAPEVENNGTITANLGTVDLAAVKGFAVDLRGDGKILFDASDAVEKSAVTNTGKITAKSGLVSFTVQQAKESVMNLDGVIDATNFDANHWGGRVILVAKGDTEINISKDLQVKTSLYNEDWIFDIDNHLYPDYGVGYGYGYGTYYGAGTGGFVDENGDFYYTQTSVQLDSEIGDVWEHKLIPSFTKLEIPDYNYSEINGDIPEIGVVDSREIEDEDYYNYYDTINKLAYIETDDGFINSGAGYSDAGSWNMIEISGSSYGTPDTGDYGSVPYNSGAKIKIKTNPTEQEIADYYNQFDYGGSSSSSSGGGSSSGGYDGSSSSSGGGSSSSGGVYYDGEGRDYSSNDDYNYYGYYGDDSIYYGSYEGAASQIPDNMSYDIGSIIASYDMLTPQSGGDDDLLEGSQSN